MRANSEPAARAAVLAEIHAAFGSVERPKRFTVQDGDPECMDHDRLLSSRTRGALRVKDIGNSSYNPVNECLPDGFAYYFPDFVRITLEQPAHDLENDWSGIPIIWKLSDEGGKENRFYNILNAEQKQAVLHYLEFMVKHRRYAAREASVYNDLKACLALWHKLVASA